MHTLFSHHAALSPSLSLTVRSCSERLQLKKDLNCRSFSWYREKFHGKALCDAEDAPKPCGTVHTVDYSELPSQDEKVLFGLV